MIKAVLHARQQCRQLAAFCDEVVKSVEANIVGIDDKKVSQVIGRMKMYARLAISLCTDI